MNVVDSKSGRLLAAGALAALLAGCSTVSPDELQTELADVRQEMSSSHDQLSSRIDGVEGSVQALERRMNQLESELESLADEYETTVARLESSLRFAAPVHFAFDAAEVRSGDQELLMRFASVVNEHYPGALITVEGFTDPAGPAEYNMQLGQRRADNVRTMLVDQGGLSADRVRAVSYGEDTRRLVNPNAAGSNTEGAMANRRVVLVVEHATQGRMSSMSSTES